MMTESELIDTETISSLRAVLEDGVLELFREFIADGPRALRRIETAVDCMDTDEINKAAHYLKGSAGNIGAIGLSNACLALEVQAKNIDLNDALQQLNEIKQIYDQTVQYMESHNK